MTLLQVESNETVGTPYRLDALRRLIRTKPARSWGAYERELAIFLLIVNQGSEKIGTQEAKDMNESAEGSSNLESTEVDMPSSASTSLPHPARLNEKSDVINEHSQKILPKQEESEKSTRFVSNIGASQMFIGAATIIGVIATLLIFLFGDNILNRIQDSSTISVTEPQEIEEFDFQPSFAFNNPEFIHPRIVNDLIGWISDGGNQIVSINLNDSQDSNRYSGEISVEFEGNESTTPWIYWREKKTIGESGNSRLQYNGYKFIGSTIDGVQAIHFRTKDGGAIVRNFVLFAKIDIDRIFYYSHEGLSEDEKTGVEPRYQIREILNLVGMIFLGDRWEGSIAISDGEVIVSGRDVYDRCEEGGSSENERFEFILFDGVECKVSPAEFTPQIYSYKIPPADFEITANRNR